MIHFKLEVPENCKIQIKPQTNILLFLSNVYFTLSCDIYYKYHPS